MLRLQANELLELLKDLQERRVELLEDIPSDAAVVWMERADVDIFSRKVRGNTMILLLRSEQFAEVDEGALIPEIALRSTLVRRDH